VGIFKAILLRLGMWRRPGDSEGGEVSRLAPGAVAIVVALPWEATPLAKHLGLTKSEVLDGVTRYHGWGGRLLLIQAGMGAHGAARALTSLETPSLLLSAGFCGGLRPEIGLADIIIGSQVVRNTRSFPADPFLLESASRAFKTIDCPVHVGTILTVDEVVTPADGIQGRAEPEILAVEMESAHLAEAAQRHGVPFLAIRVVSDTPSAPWATEGRHLLKPDGRLNPASLATSLLRQPSRIPRLLHLASKLRPATRRLAQGIEALVKSLGG